MSCRSSPAGTTRRRWLAGAAAALAGCAVPLPVLLQRPVDEPLCRIGFGTCIDQNRPQPIWDAVLAQQPELFIFGGDNVYASLPPWSSAGLRAAYAKQAREPGFAKLRRSVAQLAIWDDHDYGLNDGDAQFAHKHESKAAFLDFWGIAADDARRLREGLYHALSFGPPGRRVQVVLLDVRWFRSPWRPSDRPGERGREIYMPDGDPAKTMLGDAQWQWLGAQLREPAELRLLVSGIQVLADGHGFERWGNFPRERERLIRLIAETRAQRVVLLSGDRHFGALYRETNGTPYPLHELTSSGITHVWREAVEPGPNRIGELFAELHFGWIEIDWQARRVLLALKDSDGATRRSLALCFDEIEGA